MSIDAQFALFFKGPWVLWLPGWVWTGFSLSQLGWILAQLGLILAQLGLT